MRIEEILKEDGQTRFSLEVFPPKTRSRGGITLQQRLSHIFDTIEILSRYDPVFVSVTYNTDNLTKATSIPVAAIIKERFKIETIAHLTCINTLVNEVERTLDVLEYFNIRSILALRGDRQSEQSGQKNELLYASELVGRIKASRKDMSVGVASYPEGHPECVDERGARDLERDLDHLEKKIGEGADFTITQLFLDNSVFLRMKKRLEGSGVEIPIIPGIMPMISKGNLNVVRNLTGAGIPEGLSRRFEDSWEDPKEVFEIGIDHAVKQCKGLMDRVPCIHFYTMDAWEATDRIIKELI